MKKYYYVKGNEKIGPLSFEEFKALSLNRDALVWKEGETDWKSLENFKEFKEVIPPPLPKRKLRVIDENNKSKGFVTHEFFSDSNVLGKVKFILSIVLILGLAICFGISYINVRNKVKKDYEILNASIDLIFDGRTEIFDAIKSGVIGEEMDKDIKSSKSNKGKLTNIDKRFLLTENKLPSPELETVFFCERGGFTIKKLMKKSDGYALETVYSQNMGFKNPRYTWVPPQYYRSYSDGKKYKYAEGYTIKTNRPTAQQAYNSALDFLTKEDESGTYTPGKWNEIVSFPDINTKYHYIDNVYPSGSVSSGRPFKTWKANSNIYNDNWIVYYEIEGQQYKVIEKKNLIQEALIKKAGIFSGIFLIFFALLVFTKPKYFRNLKIFGKRWKDNSGEIIMSFNYKAFSFHKYIFQRFDHLERGNFEFSDEGNAIILKTKSDDLYYSILKLDKTNLTLIDNVSSHEIVLGIETINRGHDTHEKE